LAPAHFCALRTELQCSGKANWLTPDKKASVKANLNATASHRTGRLSVALRDRRVWTLACIMLTYNVGLYGLSFWLPTIIKNAGINGAFHIGLLSAIPWVFATVAMFVNAFHSRRTGERRWHAAIPALVAGISLMASAATAGNLAVSLFFLTLSASGIVALIPIFFTFPASILSGTAAAAGIAMITSIGSLSGILGAFITSLAKDWTGNVNNGTYVLGLSLVIAGALVLTLPKNIFGRAAS
jgi:cyanate permease